MLHPGQEIGPNIGIREVFVSSRDVFGLVRDAFHVRGTVQPIFVYLQQPQFVVGNIVKL